MATTMEIPTDKALLDRIKSGDVRVGLVPCPVDRIPDPGDRITFLEATFEFGNPTLVPFGRSVSASLTSVSKSRDEYRGDPLCTLRWETSPVVESVIAPGFEEWVHAMRDGWRSIARNLLSFGLNRDTVRTGLKDVMVKELTRFGMDAHGEELFFSLVANAINEIVEEEAKTLEA